MRQQESRVTRETRNAILCSAAQASSEQELAKLFLRQLVQDGVDRRRVSLDEIKDLLREAIRIQRENTPVAATGDSPRITALRSISAWARARNAVAGAATKPGNGVTSRL